MEQQQREKHGKVGWLSTRLDGMMCQECGEQLAREIWRGRSLCRKCLIGPDSVEYLAENWWYWVGPKSMLGKV